VDLTFSGEIFYWRGPSPFHFVATPDPITEEIAAVAPKVSYGWGMVPGAVRLGGTEFDTALWPKDGRYLVPLRDAVRRAEDVDDGDIVTLALHIEV
jgi:hypothetical protein